MYSLIIDGEDKSAQGNFNSLDDALWWYNYAAESGASSAVLWCGTAIIQYFIKESL
jgi:TPR repeat protein